jgi:peptidoglycan/LPS O-acetylase OafA/YrhL
MNGNSFPGRLKEKLFKRAFETPQYLNVSNIPSIDGLRAVSILIVVLGHFRLSVNMPHTGYVFFNTLFGGGQLGVKLFFVISGFLITTLLIKEKIKTDTINLKKFYIRRFLRIFPVFYLFLIVIIVLNFVMHLAIPWYIFLTAALYLTNFFIYQTHWTMVHFWSLSVEEQYYLVWPALFKKNHNLALIIAVVVICIAPVFEVTAALHPSLLNWLLVPFFHGADCIFIGSVFAILAFKGCINWTFFAKYKIAVNFIGFFLVWFVTHIILKSSYSEMLLPFGHTITVIIIGCIIISNIIPSKDLFYKLFNSKPFVIIGRLSYSIYVWQQLFTFAPKGFPLQSFTWNTAPYNLIFIAIISACSYYFYERFFLRIKTRFKV